MSEPTTLPFLPGNTFSDLTVSQLTLKLAWLMIELFFYRKPNSTGATLSTIAMAMLYLSTQPQE